MIGSIFLNQPSLISADITIQDSDKRLFACKTSRQKFGQNMGRKTHTSNSSFFSTAKGARTALVLYVRGVLAGLTHS